MENYGHKLNFRQYIKKENVKKIGASCENTDKSSDIYNKLLYLVCKYPKRVFVVPEIADTELHLHILHTRRFLEEVKENNCINAIHHNPELFGTRMFWDAWEYTVSMFKEEFGINLSSSVSRLNSGPGYCSVFQAAAL
jgi:hypothetical protein